MKFVLFTLVILISLGLLIFISYFVWFYRDLNSVNLSSFLLKDLAIIGLISLISLLLPFLIFQIRTRLSTKFYFTKSELSTTTIKFLTYFDILVSVLVSLIVILNVKNFYYLFTLADISSLTSNISDFPFVFICIEVLLLYFILILVYTILPILVFSHRGYYIRFLFLKIVPHKISLFTSIFLFTLGLLFAVFILFYSFIEGLELYPNYSLVISVGLVTSLVVLLYSVILLIRLLTLREVRWFENFIFIVFLVLFFAVGLLPKNVQSISFFRIEFLENFYSALKNSNYALKINKVDVSQVFDKINISDLKKLIDLNVKESELGNYSIKPITILRKLSVIERIAYLINTRFVDKTFSSELIVTNKIYLPNLIKDYLMGSVVSYFSLSNTNYVEISYYFRFLNSDFFYKRNLISYTDGKDLKIYDIVGKFDKILPSHVLSTKDKFLINSVFGNTYFRLFLVENNPSYYVVSSYGRSLILSNENYTSYFTKEGYEGESFLFLENVPLFISNITFSDRDVGVKLRYFYIDGIGANVSEAITNLVGNVDYYYKIIQLTNKIKNMENYLNKNPDNLPPDVVDKLRKLILN
ncbi:MAG: hypothetical protein ACP5KI_03515 [Brevinematia bacterium]